MIDRDVIARDLVIVACAISAGIHAALAPAHLDDGVAAAGGFALSALVLALLGAAVTREPSSSSLAAVAALLAGLIVSYALVATTGMPLLHPAPEPVAGLALFTKTVELVGLGAAAYLLRQRRSAPLLAPHRLKGTMT